MAKYQKLLDRVYRLLMYRSRSEKEIRDYFKLQNFKLKIKKKIQLDPKTIDEVIDVLKRQKLIKDLEFAREWVLSRQRSKQKSNRLLRQELFQKGINKEIISELLADSNEMELAERALAKKMKSWKNLENLEGRKKAILFLLRRGFDYSLVKIVIEKKLKERYNK